MKILIVFLFCFVLFGCATVERTNNLVPGMSISETKNILGQPSQTQFIANKLVLKYDLRDLWKGWIPYYLIFNKDTLKLEGWYANEEEYYRNQQLWLEAMPKQVNVNSNVRFQGNVHHSVSIY